MGQIVFAWEFGGGLGHIQQIAPLARKLQERGHDVICIMKYVAAAEKILGHYDIEVIQAPVFWQVNVNALPNTFNYAMNLFNLGYTIGDGLISMVKAWQHLFDIIKPDLTVIDHAPTALIALRKKHTKAILYGTGFAAPPQQSPMPSLIPWIKAPEGLQESSEEKVMATINKALTKLNAPPLQKLSELFAVEENILTTFKELDHYQSRKPAKYWGPVISPFGRILPSWPEIHDKKIFCYLKPGNPHFESLLYTLKRIKAACIIYAPGMSAEVAKEMQNPNLTFMHEPIDMLKVCNECDLVICHAGHGTVAVSLLFGKPLLVIPGHNQLEQALTARNVVRLKAGLAIMKPSREVGIVDGYKDAIMRLLNEPEFHKKTQEFAEKYKDFDPETQMTQIADRCEEVMRSRK